MKWLACLCGLLGLGMSVAQAGAALVATEEFVGPMPGWKNVKTDFGAVGDGKADDTTAVKKALDALAVYGKAKADDPHVIYFPAGTYRITEPLVLTNRMAIAVLGEDPARTKILYDGPAGQAILTCDGVSYSRFGRITWDGQGKASAAVAHQWDPVAKVGPAVTYMEHADEVFENAGKGIIGGRVAAVLNEKGEIVYYNHGMDAETLVKRCQFVRCDIGLSIESFNALDWWVWDSQFIDCVVGASNCAKGEYGGGHFHIYRSLFRGSKETDIRIGHAMYFGLRLNTSIGSRRFIETIRPTGYGKDSRFGRWNPEDKFGATLGVQGNRIIDPLDSTPIWLNQHGPLMLIDNTFVVNPDGDKPVVQVAPPTDGANCISIGNRFFGASGVTVKGTLTELDNQVSAYAKAGEKERAAPVLSPAAPLAQRRVFALTPKANAITLQQAIDEAAQLNGQKPVVYLPAGRYAIEKTVTIPANTDLQLIGDGCESVLTWEGENGGTMLKVAGPTRATLGDFQIVGIWNRKGATLGKGIVAENVDQAGGQILFDQVTACGCVNQGMLFDGLTRTRVETRGSGSGGTTDGPGLIVDGGGAKAGPTVGFFGSAGSNNKQTHVVRNGGNLVIWDTWYETAVSAKDAEPRYIHLTDRGNLTFFNGSIATLPGKEARRDLYTVDLDGFKGECTLIGAGFNTMNPQVRLAGNGAALRFLMLGSTFGETNPYFDNQATNATFAMRICQQSAEKGTKKVVPDRGNLTPEFLLEMLKPARTVLPSDWQPAPAGVTDLRLHRVSVMYKVSEGLTFRGQ